MFIVAAIIINYGDNLAAYRKKRETKINLEIEVICEIDLENLKQL